MQHLSPRQSLELVRKLVNSNVVRVASSVAHLYSQCQKVYISKQYSSVQFQCGNYMEHVLRLGNTVRSRTGRGLGIASQSAFHAALILTLVCKCTNPHHVTCMLLETQRAVKLHLSCLHMAHMHVTRYILSAYRLCSLLLKTYSSSIYCVTTDPLSETSF